jgi:hypothetical protein
MYEYKSETLSKGIRWVRGAATEGDASKLDELLNKRAEEGWELVTYVYTTELLNVHATMLLTFRKAK